MKSTSEYPGILIISSNRPLSERALAVLSSQYRCRIVDADITISIALKEPPDLVIIELIDHSMIELCRRIKSDLAGQLIPVLFISGEKLTLEQRLSAIDAGADDCIFGADVTGMLPSTVKIALARGRLQRQLRESQLLYQRTVESLPIYLYYARIEAGEVIPEYYSPVVEQLTGYNVSDFMNDGMFWLSIVHPEDRETIRAEILTYRGQTHHISEYRIIRKDGQIRWLRDQLNMMFDDHGQAISYFGSVDDITDRKEIEQQLASANQRLKEVAEAKARFTSQLVHDIRSPLTSILGTLELLDAEGNALQNELRQEIVSGAIKSVEQINNLAENLLVVTKLEAKRYPLKKEWARITEIIENVLSMMTGAASARQIRLTSTIPDQLPDILIDCSLIERVLINLISNSIKFSTRGSAISIDVRTNPQYLIIDVQDNGSGIAATELPQIFESYWQGKSSKGKSGMGLGLAFVKLAIAEHAGEVKVTNSVDVGSTFSIYLPLIED